MKRFIWIIFSTMISLLNAGETGEDSMVGSIAPDFTLNDENEQSHTLSDYRGQDVVVYFYPKDDTPGCTKEACGIRDGYKQFEKSAINVFGISFDGAESHRKFKEKYDLPFTLLSDLDKATAKRYGASGFFLPSRKTFLINKEGVVFKIYESVDVSSHAGDILKDYEEYYATTKP